MSRNAPAPAWPLLCAALLLASCGKPNVDNTQVNYNGDLANATGTIGDLGTNLQSVMPPAWAGASVVAGRLTKADGFTPATALSGTGLQA